MKGAYEVVVRNNKVQFKFTIQRNLTVIKGNSATGKTTLIQMIQSFQDNGASSGVSVQCERPCAVLAGSDWKLRLSGLKSTIVFIDEGARFIRTPEFSKAVEESDNYYVFATRDPLANLPYSVEEVYTLKNDTRSAQRYHQPRRYYTSFKRIYTPAHSSGLPDTIIVEDSNSGFEFFQAVAKKHGIRCISAGGKDNVFSALASAPEGKTLVIADGAAFGPEMDKVAPLCKIKGATLYLPESFEWLVLTSGLIKDSDIPALLANPAEYIESHDYVSWERFFSAELIRRTNDTYLQYRKAQLNPIYTRDHELEAIAAAMPEVGL